MNDLARVARAGSAGTSQCRRRDSNPRHADYDSVALWLYRAKNGGWGTQKGDTTAL